tara:strand:- start:35728 stop:37800 length:2073 start_codon:yes stop_codon:yes gene_type:complete
MNAKSRFLATTLAYVLIATLYGCSKSTKEAEALPELISAVNFPFIKNDTIYSFNPETGDSEALATAETGLILALDTDESNKETDDEDNEFFAHSIEAEYFVYANKQTLHIYDINTRKDHQIYDFKNDISFDPESQKITTKTNNYICDIQKIVTWDEDTRLSKIVLYKDELGVYVKTSNLSDCSDPTGIYNYWQIIIKTMDETFTIRRNTLLTHTHINRHFHDHDDENYPLAASHKHEHTLKKGEPDKNGEEFDPNDHDHKHEHDHDFLFEDTHPHDFLSKEEVDAVHNDLRNQKIIFETHPLFIGKKTTLESIDEALMYSGKPVIDTANRRFGYLGFNTTDSALKFYSVDTEDPDLKKTFLWELSNENLDLIDNAPINSKLSDLEKLTPKYNRSSIFKYADKNILITTTTKLIYFTLQELFDDDESEAREARISSPLFVSEVLNPALSKRIKYNNTNKKLTITEDKDVWGISFEDNDASAATLIKRFNEPFLSEITSTYLTENIVIEKNFIDQDIKQESIILLEELGLENRTVLSKTFDTISTIHFNNQVLINVSDSNFQMRSAEFFSNNLGSTLSFDKTIWSRDTVDYRNNKQQDTVSLINSVISYNEANTIAEPSLYLFDKNNTDGQGEEFGNMLQDISAVNTVVIFTDLYGMVEVENADSSISTYFFSNQKSSFNFDNEYKTMKALQ